MASTSAWGSHEPSSGEEVPSRPAERQGADRETCGLDGGLMTEPCSSGGVGTLAACALITKINWGIGMIAMPFYLRSAGLWSGLAFFVLSMALAADSALGLARLCREVPGCGGVTSYAELMRRCLGRPGEAGAVLSLLVANWGSSIAWIKFISDNLTRFLPEVGLSRSSWIASLAIPLMCCAFIDNVQVLERFSGLGLVAGQGFVILLLASSAPHVHELPAYMATQPMIRWSTFPVAVGLAVFCNEGMVVMSPSVLTAMRRPRSFAKAILGSVTYFSANYLAVALCGDFMYSYLAGGSVAQEVTLSDAFRVTLLHRIAVYCYISQLVLTFPSVLFVVFVSLESMCRPRARKPALRAARATLIFVACLVAALVPSFGDFLAVLGAAGNSLGIYILTHWALLRQGSLGVLRLSPLRKAASWIVLAVFGVFLGALSTAISLQQLLQ